MFFRPQCIFWMCITICWQNPLWHFISIFLNLPCFRLVYVDLPISFKVISFKVTLTLRRVYISRESNQEPGYLTTFFVFRSIKIGYERGFVKYQIFITDKSTFISCAVVFLEKMDPFQSNSLYKTFLLKFVIRYNCISNGFHAFEFQYGSIVISIQTFGLWQLVESRLIWAIIGFQNDWQPSFCQTES